MNLVFHHVSPVSASMTESLYGKVKREWVHHFQSLSLEGSTELVAVATEPLTSASQLPMGWALHTRGASVRLSQTVRQYSCLREARNTVMDEIGLKHPIMFDVYDVCSLARGWRLPSLKVKVLRDMCKHFELAFKIRDTKTTLLAKMEEMISEWSCNAVLLWRSPDKRMRYPFSQELSRVMNSDCYADRCDDQISFVPVC